MSHPEQAPALPVETGPDRGARNIVLAFFAVVVGLLGFYGYLAKNALQWSPSFFIVNAESERSAVAISREPRPRPAFAAVERGRATYRTVGCALCHGVNGKGGVTNPNYIQPTTPALAMLTDRIGLKSKADADKYLLALESGKPLASDTLDVDGAGAIVAQHESVRNLILQGNKPGKKDPNGTVPFEMPPWKDVLTPRQVDDIIAYLVSLNRWETAPK